MTSVPQQLIGETSDDWSKCQEQRHGSVPTWKRRATEPSVRPEQASVRALRGFSPLSPCPRAHPLTTTDTLPQSLQLKYLQPATVTELFSAKSLQCHTNKHRLTADKLGNRGSDFVKPLRRKLCVGADRGVKPKNE